MFINQVTGKKIPPLLFPKTHMPWRMPWRMDYLNKSVPNINYIIILQHSCGIALKKLISAYVITFRQVATVNDHAFNLLHCQREFAVKPVQFSPMRVKVREKSMSANMVPVNVGSYGDDRLVS
ncbi:hypothetical protein LZ24_03489 [Desulfobotulus alkaliphilus]|uniref:Uncharacterized protein n=1 Tax=Desulfobotulus alkaliphilus TaxID=622671 RepID=A0A562QW11_9BACT|nr:hypothetical protein LZ24_03489 [Desulfobotulus alkaliphilus]